MKKRASIYCASAVCFAFVAAAALFAPAVAKADANILELSPVETDSLVTYHYFDSPVDVFADASGIIVSGTSLEYVTREADSYSVTGSRNVTSQKTARYGEYILTLEDGVLTCRYGDDAAAYDGDEFADFCISSDTFYGLSDGYIVRFPLGEDGIDTSTPVKTSLYSSVSDRVYASAITVCGGYVYVVTDSAFGNKQDICGVNAETGFVTPVMMQSDKILSITSMEHSQTVYTLTRDKLTGYSASGGGLNERYVARDGRMNKIFAFDGFIYGLDTLDALYRISSDLKEFTPLVAAANDSNGFFDMPSSAAAKNSTLYVADTVNDRIVAYGSDYAVVKDGIDRPVSVACDSTGTIYAAYGYNKVTTAVGDRQVDFSVGGAIEQLVVNSDKVLYVSASDGLYRYDGAATKIGGPFKAITLGVGKENLYALTDSKVVKLDYSNGALAQNDYCNAPSDALSIAVDLKGNVFILSRETVTRVSADGKTDSFALTLDGEPYSLGSASGELILGAIDNKYISYGGAVIVDTYKHRVFTADGSANGLDVKLVDDGYEVPDVSGNKPDFYGDGLIRTVLYETPVFSLPAETPAVYTVAEGRKVIVPYYELDDAREYSLILVDDIENGKLIQGYVYKDALSEPLPYSDPPVSVGSIYTNATPIYKWPSPNSQALDGYGAEHRGTNYTLLPFVNQYRDDYDNLWYKVSVDGGEGYILSVNLSLMHYDPVFIRPAYNAEIVSVDGSEYTPAYMYDEQTEQYAQIATTFPTGTKVEVVGVFDTSEKYTLVKYLDEKFGTLTCYVPTEYIKYTGVNIVPIIAGVVIAITLILAAIIIGRVVYLNKKRLVSNPSQKEETDFDEQA